MSGRRVLVLEDEALIAFDLASILEGQGHAVCGPHTTQETALAEIERAPPDAALIDVNLGKGVTSRAVAEALRRHDVPFAFLTGYAKLGGMFDEGFSEVMRLGKPCPPQLLLRAVSELLEEAARAEDRDPTTP